MRKLLWMTLLLTFTVTLQAQESCELEEVKIGFQAKTCAFQDYSIELNGVEATGGGNGCLSFAEFPNLTNKAWTRLKVNETYTVTAGTNLCITHINFEVPEGYTMYIEGVEGKTIFQTNQGMIRSGDGSWDVVVRKKCPCGEDVPGTAAPEVGSVAWFASLGKLRDGRSAERITLSEKVLSSVIYTPAALVYSAPPKTNEIEVILNTGSLRQIKAPQALADIVTINPSKYEIRYYKPADVGAKSGGLYTVLGPPYVTWEISNPDPSTITKLEITRIENGLPTDKAEYTWDSAIDSWRLRTGWSGTGYAREETVFVSYPTSTSRTETFVVKGTDGVIVSKKAKTYLTYPWGEELVQEVVDPDGAALTTTYTHYENPSETHRYQKVRSVVFPDGSWEKYDYDVFWNISTIIRPWKDLDMATATENNSHVTIYGYTNSDNGVFGISDFPRIPWDVEERINGITVRKSRYLRSIFNVDPDMISVTDSSYSQSINLVAVNLIGESVTTYYRFSAPQFLANRVAMVVHQDGSKDTYTYEQGNYVPNADPALSTFVPDVNGLAERQTVVHGSSAAPDGVAFKTTKDTVVRDQFGNAVLLESYVYNGSGYERFAWSANDYDARGHLTMTRNHKGEVATVVWTGERKTSEVDSSGVETTYAYDVFGRMTTRTKKGIAAGGGFAAQTDTVTSFEYDADGQVTSEKIEGVGGLSLTNKSWYDRAGRLIKDKDHANLHTLYSYTNGGRTQTVTRPGGATEVTDKYLDRQTKSVTGTGVVVRHFDYGVNGDGTRYTQEFTGAAGLSSPRWTKTTIDWMSRRIAVEKPSFTGVNVIESSTYNMLGQLQKQTTTANAVRLIADTLFEYDELGRRIRAGSDVDNNGTLTLVSTDRLQETETIFEKVGNDWFQVASSRTYLTDNNGTPVSRTQRDRLNNFPLNGTDQTVAEMILEDVAGNQTKTTTTVDRASKKKITTTDPPHSNLNAVIITVNGLLQSASGTIPQAPVTFAYDSLGRQIGITDPSSGNISRTFNPTTGQVVSTNDGAGATNHEYYPDSHLNAGLLKSQTNAENKKKYFVYNGRGELLQTWGDTTHPVEYVYDSYGQMTELRTFRAGQNWSAGAWPSSTTGTADVTKWIYQEATGLVTQKQDAALKGATYTYDELGRMKARAWARGITCTYGYDGITGELRTLTYSDNTPAVSFAYDRGGRQTNVTDAAGAHTRTFNAAGELQGEQITGAILDGVSVTVGYDSFLRRNSLQSGHGSTTLTSQTYGYDVTSRLQTVTSGSQTATYAYHANSGLLNTTTFTGGTNIARTYDSIGRLESITTTPTAAAAKSFTYTHNHLNQRTRVTREDGSYWSYVYNDRGELISGKKSWSDNAIVWGAQTEYQFDNIGNRSIAKNGGNELGILRPSNYTTNSLNQYTQRTVPGAVDVTGTANIAATVTVNNETTVRKGEYFYKELLLDNSSSPVSQQINVVGARNNFGAGGEDAVTQKGGRALIPRSPEAFTYDDDGNLTSDGRWILMWDGENRLLSMEAAAGVPVEAKLRLEFAYDNIGRRIQKKVFSWDVGTAAYQLQSTSRFVHDGWDLLVELDQNNSVVRSYSWSNNQLLTVAVAGSIHLAGYDGNQNVALLVNAATGSLSATYEYDPFGQTLKATGPDATKNPIRFSSVYTDVETDLVYYGYRYYNPQTARWLSRDPSGEESGINLYGFISNDGVNATDHLGLWKAPQEWSGGWSKYYATAIAECGDSLSKLAELITGDRRDRRALKESDPVHVDQKVDVGPLLNILERKARLSVVAATKEFKIRAFNDRPEGSGDLNEEQIISYFNSAGNTSDCTQAAAIVQAKGLIDVMREGEFSALGLTLLNLPDVSMTGGPQQMWLGDSAYLRNYSDYRRKTYEQKGRVGPWVGENLIKVGPGRFWGLVIDPAQRVQSFKTWERILIKEYTDLPGPVKLDDSFGFQYKISFPDIAWVAWKLLPLRQKK